MSVATRTAPVVELRAITKIFGSIAAVRDVSFAVQPGEVHALVGENGAGKSTLMKILDGVQLPTSGEVLVDGRPVTFSSVRDAEHAGVAMIPQELELFTELTVAENLYVGRPRPRTRIGLIDYKAMRDKARELFDRLGVKINPNAPVSGLRAATRQLVAIARALLADARVLIMDEPTASLTDQEAQRLFRVVADLSAGGVAVIYISHRLDEIFEISDTISVLRDGQLLQTEPTTNYDHKKLIQLMVGRPLEQLYARTRHPIGKPVLEVANLTRPGDFTDISFTVHAGEIVGLSGLIGAGRTEVAHAVFGLARHSTGTIRLNGQQVQIPTPKRAQELGIAYVPEERRAEGLILPFSIATNITFASLEKVTRFGLVNRKAERQLAIRFEKELSIRTSSLDKPVGLLSGGNQQKVVVAKALAREPSVLILDEPTRGVDVGAKAEIYRLIDDLAAAGKAVLLISSELPEVLSMADRIIVLQEGTMAAEFSHTEATADAVGTAAAGAHHAVDAAGRISPERSAQ